MKLLKNPYFWFSLIFILGIFLRIYQFPNTPPGINQDEAAAGYEAYSILMTGRDKWGNPLPVYFPAWGSGQNALLIYTMIPSIALFGLNVFAVRFPSLILGILTLPIVFLLVRKLYGNRAALIASGLLAILPWHVMMSRWSLESNILPFIFSLGLLLLTYSLSWKDNLNFLKKFIIVIALIPFALCFYSYSLTLFVVPVFLALVFWFNKKVILQNKKLWSSSIGLFLFFSFPMGLFILQNNILKTNFGIPFIPLFPSSRISQITEVPYLQMLSTNIWFFFTGFNDFLDWNTAKYYLPLSPFIYVFFVIGIVINLISLKKGELHTPFATLLAYIIPFFLVPMNVNRFNVGLLIIIIISSEGMVFLIDSLNTNLKLQNWKKYILPFFFALLFGIYSLSFANYYFGNYREDVKGSFNYNLDSAINFAKEKSIGHEKIYLSTYAPINYVYYDFLAGVDPSDFQQNANVEIINGSYQVNSFYNFYFVKKSILDSLESNEKFLAILKSNEEDICDTQKTYIYDDGIWRIQECNFN